MSSSATTRTLKLGDFGIVRHQSDRRGIRTRTLNRLTAPLEILDGARAQVAGAGRRLSGRPAARHAREGRRAERAFGPARSGGSLHRPPEGDRLPLHRRAPEAVRERRRAHRRRCATGPRRSEGRRAAERSTGVHLAFTGILTKHRSEAVRAARAGGSDRPRLAVRRTNVVVRGRPNPLQAAGREGGRKLLEIKRLREKGHRITLLDEKRFWRLAARPRA